MSTSLRHLLHARDDGSLQARHGRLWGRVRPRGRGQWQMLGFDDNLVGAPGVGGAEPHVENGSQAECLDVLAEWLGVSA